MHPPQRGSAGPMSARPGTRFYLAAGVTVTCLATSASLPPSDTTRFTNEGHLCRQVRGSEWLLALNDEMKDVCPARRQSWLVRTAADHPFGGLANHLALLVQQENRSPRRFDLFGKRVLHRERHHGLAAGDLWLLRDHQGGIGQQRAEQQNGEDEIVFQLH